MQIKILRIGILFALLTIASLSKAQGGSWSTLAMIKYVDVAQVEEDNTILKMIRGLEGEEMVLKGYIIPLEGKKAQAHLMFSAYPYANCFFCGQAGIESVVEVFMKEGEAVEYSDEAIEIKGIFRYIPSSFDEIMYKLENATVVE